MAGALSGAVAGVGRWWFEPMPLARIAWLRHLTYAFVVIDVLWTTPWVDDHRDSPRALYHPLLAARLLHLPEPTPRLIGGVMVALLALAVLAQGRRFPRLLGWLVFACYFAWMLIAFSYGKVNHDRFAFLVLLAVLATVGPASTRDHTLDERAGWAVRSIQVAVVLTYFLSAWAKFRFGGLAWLNSAALLVGVIRRGTEVGRALGEHPWLLQVSQYVIVTLELASPLLLVRWRRWWVGAAIAYGFHLSVYLTVRISFLPHCIALMAFLPVERLRGPAPGGTATSPGRAGAGPGTTRTGAPAPA